MVPGPTIARPGSTTRRGTGSPTAADSLRTMARACRPVRPPAADHRVDTRCQGRHRDRRSRSERSCRRRTRPTMSRSRPITRCAASSKPATSKICDPIWLCRPDQSQVIGGEHPPHRGHRRAVGQRQPELLVFVGGGDELVGVGFDADGDADQHILDDAGLARDGVEALDLDHRVDDDMTDAGLDGRGQLGDRFVVAVQRDPLGREVGMQRDGQLAAGAHVQRQAFFVDPARYFAAQEGLSGVVHVVRRRRMRPRSRGTATGSRLRRSRTAGCRTPARATAARHRQC